MGSEEYASGAWRVREGSEREFIARWGEWLRSSTASVGGFISARLLQDSSDPGHFVSFSSWNDAQSRADWKASPDFATGLASCRELCDDFQSADYIEVVSI